VQNCSDAAVACPRYPFIGDHSMVNSWNNMCNFAQRAQVMADNLLTVSGPCGEPIDLTGSSRRLTLTIRTTRTYGA
jgi:hypothetical protein